MKFCPKCGTPRAANFCAGCGFNFAQQNVQVGVGAPVVATTPQVATPQVASAPIAGWYADPITPHQERFWNGLTWTESVRSSLPAIETPMLYGEGFAPATHCYNCGEPKPKAKSATNCKLCDAELVDA
jgi:hypothetical protein